MSKFKGVKHPNVFEVNTRVLLRSIGDSGAKATLSAISQEYLQTLADRGIDYVWMMGVWQLRELEINPDGISSEMRADFDRLLQGMEPEDLEGSPYAIEDYVVDPSIGGEEELAELRKRLHQLGMGLILDFIPNHFGAHTHWLHTHPEYFIEVGETAWNIDQTTFYTPATAPGKYFGHGKDPYFDAWQDTIQVDYAFEGTHEFMIMQLKKVASQCDGVRCDMAMLPVKRIFHQTWGNYTEWRGDEFWPKAIEMVREEYTDFTFIAECYWDMEAELLEMGFNYSYDKTFYDRLADAAALKQHFNADNWYLDQTVRFLENHDEERASEYLPLQQHMASAALLRFSPGMRLWHMGQWEGFRTKLPVQLNRAPMETCACLLNDIEDSAPCACAVTFYRNLFNISDHDILAHGNWSKVNIPNMTEAMFAWQWNYKKEGIVLLVNFSQEVQELNTADLTSAIGPDVDALFPQTQDPEHLNKLQPWGVYLFKIR